MKNLQGKVIVVTGGPRTGKSTLVRLLAKKINAIALPENLEQPKDFPNEILETLKNGKGMLRLRLWFRNKTAKAYLHALSLKEAGATCILDTFWMTNDVYVRVLNHDSFEVSLLHNLSQTDHAVFSWPDIVICLYSNKELIEDFVEKGGREFELTPGYVEKLSEINDAHEAYFKNLSKDKKQSIIYVDRSSLDFHNETHLDDLVVRVRQML